MGKGVDRVAEANVKTEVRSAVPDDLPEPAISPNAMKVLEKRYLGKEDRKSVV